MVRTRRIDVNAMHIHQPLCRTTPPQPMDVEADALLQNVRVPAAVARLAAQDELDGRVEQFEGLGPLVGLAGVFFLGELGDLPGAPDFVSEGPVFDLDGG